MFLGKRDEKGAFNTQSNRLPGTASLLSTCHLANKTTCRLPVVKPPLYQYLSRISTVNFSKGEREASADPETLSVIASLTPRA